MAKKVNAWIIIIIVILAALLIANLFVSSTIFAAISSNPNSKNLDRSPTVGLLRLIREADSFADRETSGEAGGFCGCSYGYPPPPIPGLEVMSANYDDTACTSHDDDLACVLAGDTGLRGCKVTYIYQSGSPPQTITVPGCVWNQLPGDLT